MIQDIDNRPASLFLMRVFYYLVVLTLFTALLNKQWELIFVGCIILGIVFGAKTWSRLSLKKMHCDVSVPTHRLFPGDAIKIATHLENAKWLPIWIQLHVSVDSRLRPSNVDRYLSKESWVWSYKTINLNLRLPVRKRGIYAIGPFQIRGGDLLGFFAKGRTSPETFEVIVYPRVKKLKYIQLPCHDFFGTPGAKHPVDDPIYLLGTRDYAFRRPAKFIHWKASARLGRLQEKLCEPSAQAKVLLTIDVTPFEAHDAFEAFEEVLEVAASMAIQMHQRGLGVGLLTNGITAGDTPGLLSVGFGANQLSAVLETMARLRMRAKKNIQDALMSGIGLTAGVSFAHFSLLRDMNTRESESIYTFLKLSGAFFVCHPEDAADKHTEELPPHYHYIDDVCICDETTELDT